MARRRDERSALIDQLNEIIDELRVLNDQLAEDIEEEPDAGDA